jgi:hypothetical protein
MHSVGSEGSAPRLVRSTIIPFLANSNTVPDLGHLKALAWLWADAGAVA